MNEIISFEIFDHTVSKEKAIRMIIKNEQLHKLLRIQPNKERIDTKSKLGVLETLTFKVCEFGIKKIENQDTLVGEYSILNE